MKTMKQPYTAPDVKKRRVFLEEEIAGTLFSVQMADWEAEEVVGDEHDEGGDLWIPWN
jgi:hypothetical protein